MEDLQFDTTPSLSRDYIYRYEDSPDANFITIYPGEIKVQVFNPDNAGGSPAGARRMKVEYTSLLGATQHHQHQQVHLRMHCGAPLLVTGQRTILIIV